MTEKQAFGAVVRALRESLDLSQEGLADEAGLHRTYIGGVERGERNLSLENIHRIARALGMTVGALLAEADKLLDAEEPAK